MSAAVVATAFGGPEVLSVIDVPQPEPGPGEVRVAVRAAAANPIDHKRYSGAFGTDASQLPMRLGSEAAGVVEAIGAGASARVGDEVIVFRADGAYAEQLVAAESELTAKPPALPWEQAAGLLLAGTTAVNAVTDSRARAGDTILVHGAAGAVGSMVVQLAAAQGIRVVATARPERHDRLAELGATPIAYGGGLLERARDAAPEGYVAAPDLVGTDEAVDVSLGLVAEPARVVSIAAFARGGDGITVIGGSDAEAAALRDAARAPLAELAGRGDIVVDVAATFPLAEAAAAHRLLLEGHADGKVVLLP